MLKAYVHGTHCQSIKHVPFQTMKVKSNKSLCRLVKDWAKGLTSVIWNKPTFAGGEITKGLKKISTIICLEVGIYYIRGIMKQNGVSIYPTF